MGNQDSRPRRGTAEGPGEHGEEEEEVEEEGEDQHCRSSWLCLCTEGNCEGVVGGGGPIVVQSIFAGSRDPDSSDAGGNRKRSSKKANNNSSSSSSNNKKSTSNSMNSNSRKGQDSSAGHIPATSARRQVCCEREGDDEDDDEENDCSETDTDDTDTKTILEPGTQASFGESSSAGGAARVAGAACHPNTVFSNSGASGPGAVVGAHALQHRARSQSSTTTLAPYQLHGERPPPPPSLSSAAASPAPSPHFSSRARGPASSMSSTATATPPNGYPFASADKSSGGNGKTLEGPPRSSLGITTGAAGPSALDTTAGTADRGTSAGTGAASATAASAIARSLEPIAVAVAAANMAALAVAASTGMAVAGGSHTTSEDEDEVEKVASSTRKGQPGSGRLSTTGTFTNAVTSASASRQTSAPSMPLPPTMTLRGPGSASNLGEPSRGPPCEALRAGEVFLVELTESLGRHLGVDVNHTDKRTLRVVQLKSFGLIPEWNRAVAERRGHDHVEVGDRIIAINGIEGNASRMIQACKESQKLLLQVRRAG